MITEETLLPYVCERFLTDEKYRSGHVHILAPAPGTRILGMHTPEMKSVARELVRSGEWRQQLELWKRHTPYTGADGLTHEERMIWGLVIDYAKISLEERLQLMEAFIPAIDNWAICDNFCCNAKWAEKADKEILWRHLEGLIASEEEFRARVGLILSLAHFLDPAHLTRTLDCVARRKFKDDDPYYIRMGAAWLFAEGLVKQYDTTLPYITEHRLGRWIHNKSIQKARESFRIDETRKTELKNLIIKNFS